MLLSCWWIATWVACTAAGPWSGAFGDNLAAPALQLGAALVLGPAQLARLREPEDPRRAGQHLGAGSS